MSQEELPAELRPNSGGSVVWVGVQGLCLLCLLVWGGGTWLAHFALGMSGEQIAEVVVPPIAATIGPAAGMLLALFTTALALVGFPIAHHYHVKHLRERGFSIDKRVHWLGLPAVGVWPVAVVLFGYLLYRRRGPTTEVEL